VACRANGATLTCSDAWEHALGLRDCVLEEPGTQLVVDLLQKTLTHCCHQFLELRFLSQVEQRHEEEVTLNPGAWKSNSVRLWSMESRCSREKTGMGNGGDALSLLPCRIGSMHFGVVAILVVWCRASPRESESPSACGSATLYRCDRK
jgi:hypothetical protein